MMKKVLATVLFLCNVGLLTHAQQSSTDLAARKNDVRLGANSPTIYLTFERLGKNDSIWLRLHNNTRWAISFRTEDVYSGASVTPLMLGDGRYVPGLVEGFEIVPEYFIEHTTEKITSSGQYWCTGSASWLPPGHSVIFSFPRKTLKEWEQIYVTFSYEWESGGYDPEHRVKFYGTDLRNVK